MLGHISILIIAALSHSFSSFFCILTEDLKLYNPSPFLSTKCSQILKIIKSYSIPLGKIWFNCCPTHCPFGLLRLSETKRPEEEEEVEVQTQSATLMNDKFDSYHAHLPTHLVHVINEAVDSFWIFANGHSFEGFLKAMPKLAANISQMSRY